MADQNDEITRLSRQIMALREEVKTLNNHRFMRIQNSPWRLMSQRFVLGLLTGLGTVVGATFLVSILVYMLTQIDFLPIIGDWAKVIVAEIEAEKPNARLSIGDRPAAPAADPVGDPVGADN